MSCNYCNYGYTFSNRFVRAVIAFLFLTQISWASASGPVLANPPKSSAMAQAGAGMNQGKFIGWQVHTNFAQEALTHAREHEVNSMILEFHPNAEQPGRGFATLVDDLALDESAPKVAKRGKAKDEVLKLRANIGGIIQQAAKQKIDVYFADFEITFPRGMTEAYPSAADLNSEFAWQFWRSAWMRCGARCRNWQELFSTRTSLTTSSSITKKTLIGRQRCGD